MGRDGFETVAALARQTTAWALSYGQLPDAAAELEQLLDRQAPTATEFGAHRD